ncbi:MAG: DMT family transporter [Anaerolineae bacterium]|nr:DMT family transporter [Anaerolineae bacterium]
MYRSNSFLLALAAIILWSALALAGAGLQSVPRLLLLGVTLLTSGLVSLARRAGWRVPARVFLVGVGGIFGYHFLYFTAFAGAPAVEVNLINYLWPLLIVLLSPLVLPGARLRPNHLLGALLGMAGAGLIATGGSLRLQTQYLPGYAAAAGAALTWALYSLLTRRLPPFPTDSVGAFCLLSGLLALGAYFLSGGNFQAVAALTLTQWIFLLLVGAGPMGAAFFFWDAALKRGDPRGIGALAYLTPLLSTLNLALFAGQRLTALSFAAMLLIIAGAVIGTIPPMNYWAKIEERRK